MFNPEDLMRIFQQKDWLSGDQIQNGIFENNNPKIKYLKSEQIFRGSIWRNAYAPRIRKSDVEGSTLVIGHSDLPLTNLKYQYLKFLGAKAVFSTNLQSKGRFAFPVPLGLSNNWESNAHRICGDTRDIQEILSAKIQRSSPRSLCLYANFSPKTYPKVRVPLLRLLRENEIRLPIKIGALKVTKEGRREYLHEMANSELVICPRGNGRDTHRFWEALYVGATPVVVESELPAKLLETYSLPIIILKDWSQLREEEKILSLYEETKAKIHNVNQLRASEILQIVKHF